MHDKSIIRPMQLADLDFAAACTLAEGWISQDYTTLLGFFLADPLGCLLAESRGQPLGMCIATSYGHSGFIGELIVLPQARPGRRCRAAQPGCGPAPAAWRPHRLSGRGLASRCTIRAQWLPQALSLLAFFRLPGGSPRSSGPSHAGASLIRRLCPDQTAFGADRSYFLGRLWSLFPELARVLIQDGQLQGYLLAQRATNALIIGPWVVDPSVVHPHCLLESLALVAGDDVLKLGVLDSHPSARELLKSLGFSFRPDNPWRMALGPDDFLGASPFCYSIGSPAKG